MKVVTLPRRGTLALNGVAVRAGESMSHAQVDSGDLTYTPPDSEHGDRIADFTFKVNDGELESARSSTITIDVGNKLAGNLDETAARHHALGTGYRRAAQYQSLRTKIPHRKLGAGTQGGQAGDHRSERDDTENLDLAGDRQAGARGNRAHAERTRGTSTPPRPS